MRTAIPSVLYMLLAFPIQTDAAMQSLNGLVAQDQFLITPNSTEPNTMHMEIVAVSPDRNRLRWDGSPWRVNQGGTGLTYEKRDGFPHGTLSVPQLWNDEPGENLSLLADGTLTLDAVNGPVVIRAGSNNIGVSSNGDSSVAYFNSNNQTLDGIFYTPDIDGTLVVREGDRLWSGNTTFSGGSGTTTVSFGELSNSSSKTCFNTKKIEGEDISFYFIGTNMVVEDHACIP
jgi:hypothetical protein